MVHRFIKKIINKKCPLKGYNFYVTQSVDQRPRNVWRPVYKLSNYKFMYGQGKRPSTYKDI